LNSDGIKKLNKLLEVPLSSDYSIFEITNFDGLITFLDYTMRKNLSLNIIHALCRPDSKEKLDSLEKIQKLIKLIQPLLVDSPDAIEEDNYSFDNNQSEVCKMIYIVKTEDPEITFQIYTELKNIFVNGGERRKKVTLPALVNCIILFCHKLSLAYDNKNNLISEEMKKNYYTNESIETYDISKIENGEAFYKLMLEIYKLLNEIISLIKENWPEVALKLYLVSASQVNSILSEKKNFEEACASFMNGAMDIYNEGKYDINHKYFLLSQICGYLVNFTILSKENLENIIKVLMETGNKMTKRGDQYNSMIDIGQIYYIVLKDGNKVLDCINKARKYANFAMTNPQNLVLFVDLLNKYLYFVDANDETVTIKADQIDEIIELIKNHIQTIKNEVSKDSSFLPGIEKYFNNTIEFIKKRKGEENHKAVYDELLNNE
jgi:hypothetical protein